MIIEFSVKTKSTNNKARAAFITCMALAFLIMMISTLIPLYKGLVSLVGMALLVAAITLYTKYLACTYFYDITFDSNGTPLFVVRQLVGKRETTLCNIPLADVIRVEKEDREARAAHKTPSGMRKYSYLPTLSPDVIYRLTTSGAYENAEIIIEANEHFAEVIRANAEEARSMREE